MRARHACVRSVCGQEYEMELFAIVEVDDKPSEERNAEERVTDELCRKELKDLLDYWPRKTREVPS